MTIATAIAPTSPLVWWKLGEGSGAVATDSGSAGKDGALSGDFGWVEPGVESATSALRLFSGAVVSSAALAITGVQQWTLAVYYSARRQGTSTTYPIVGIGDVTSPTVRGPRLGLTVSSAGVQAQGNVAGKANSGGMNPSFPDTFWHCMVFAYDPVANLAYTWTDGAVVSPPTAWSGTPVALLTTDKLWVKSDTPVVVAHVVAWERILTNTEANAISSFQSAWPYGLPVNAVTTAPVSLETTVDLTPVTTQLDTVIANQTTLDTVTLPSLADVLSTIEGMITTVETDIAAIPLPDLSGFFSSGTMDRFTLVEATSGPTSGEFSESFIGSVFGIIVRCTTVPDFYGTSGPGAVWRQPALARLSIVRGVDELFAQLVHNDHYMLYPIPGAISLYPGSVVQLPVYTPGFQVFVVFNDGVSGQVFFMQLP